MAMRCADPYSGCNLCYCSPGANGGAPQMSVMCTGVPDTDGSCATCSGGASASPCSGDTTNSGASGGCTTNADGSSYSCSEFNADGSCATTPTTTGDASGLPLSCPSGASGCAETFRGRGVYARPVYARRPSSRASTMIVGSQRPTRNHPGAFPPHSRTVTAHHPAFRHPSRQGFATPAPHPPVPAHGGFGRVAMPHGSNVHTSHQAVLGVSGYERAAFAERAAAAERNAWTLAAPSDGSYSYNPDTASTCDGDMMQYHMGGCGAGAMDHSRYIEDLALGQETRANHARWANEIAPWSAGRARKVDTLEDENYVHWQGLRGPHQPVEVANPSQVTELDPEDLASWGRRNRISQVGSGDSYDCVYNWKG